MTTAACTVRGLTKSYDGVEVFPAVDLDVPAGEVLAVIGPNGSGKTTLLRCIAGLLDVTGGTVEIGGVRVEPNSDQPEVRRRLAVATDEPALYEDLTPWQHARFVGGAWAGDDWDDRFAELLDGFDLADRGDEQVGTFSRGMRQKVALALAFCHPADLYLVDEPFSGLDARGREAFLGQLHRVCATGSGAIVATHALSRVREFSHSVLDMAPGETGEHEAAGDEV
ncbi:MAG: ABC transporter ATP-binding protein [Mycobacteriales bacterium]